MKKSLRKQLEEALESRDYYRDRENQGYSKLRKAEEELKELHREYDLHMRGEISAERQANKNLLEIIRWLANPTTAKDPFNEIERAKGGMTYRNY